MLRHIPCCRLEISVAKTPRETELDLKSFFSQRIRAPFKPIYVTAYDKEYDLESWCDQRDTAIVKGVATDIARKLRNEDFQVASKGGQADDFLEEILDELLDMNEETQLIDTLGFVKMNKTKEFFFKVDCILNVPPKNPHCIVLIPNYEGTGFNLDETVIATDIDLKSSTLIYQFAEDVVMKISGEEKVVDLQFLLVLLVEIQISKEQVEVEQIAFSVIPSRSLDFYLHGVFQLPLYAEMILFKDLEFLKDINFWEIVLMCQKRYLKGEMNKINGSLIVRLGQTELEDVYSEKNDTLLCNSMFIGEGILPEDCIFTKENVERLQRKSQKVSQIVSEDYDKNEVKDIVRSYLQNVLLKEAEVKDDTQNKENEKKEDPPSDEDSQNGQK